MSVSSILEGRRLDTTHSPSRAYEEERRETVERAVVTLQAEITRLRRLQRQDEDRRRAREATAEITAKALLKARHREAKRHLMIEVDKTLFWEIASLALSKLNGQAYAELERELTRIDDADKQRVSGG